MKRSSKTVAWLAVLVTGTTLGVFVTAAPIAAADRVPGPEATSGSSNLTAPQANYQADYHADYRVKSSEEATKGTEDSGKDTLDSRRRDQQRDERQRDWRSSPTMDRFGRTPSAWPR